MKLMLLAILILILCVTKKTVHSFWSEDWPWTIWLFTKQTYKTSL